VARDGKVGGLNVTGTYFERLSKLPVIDGIARQSLSNVQNWDRELISEQRKNVLSDRAQLRDRVDEVIAEIRVAKSDKEKKKIIAKLGDEFTPEFAKEFFQRMQTTKSVEGLRVTEDKEVIANVVISRVEYMKDRGFPDEDIREYLDELWQEGILEDERVLRNMFDLITE